MNKDNSKQMHIVTQLASVQDVEQWGGDDLLKTKPASIIRNKRSS